MVFGTHVRLDAFPISTAAFIDVLSGFVRAHEAYSLNIFIVANEVDSVVTSVYHLEKF